MAARLVGSPFVTVWRPTDWPEPFVINCVSINAPVELGAIWITPSVMYGILRRSADRDCSGHDPVLIVRGDVRSAAIQGDGSRVGDAHDGKCPHGQEREGEAGAKPKREDVRVDDARYLRGHGGEIEPRGDRYDHADIGRDQGRRENREVNPKS